MQLLHKPVLQGWQDANGLWKLARVERIPIPAKRSKQEVVANVYSLPSIPQTIWYLHAAAGFPTKDPWIKAIKHGNYTMFPGITAKAVNKHFQESVETQKGHMKKQLQNVRSIKQKLILDEPTKDIELTQAIAKQNIFVKVVNAQETVYSDQYRAATGAIQPRKYFARYKLH